MATDAVALGLAFRLAYWVRFEWQFTVAPEVVASQGTYDVLTALLIALWLVVFALFDSVRAAVEVGGSLESARTLNACTIATMLVIVATFLVPDFVISRVWLISVWLASFFLVAANRFVARRLVLPLRRRGYLLTPAVIVGTNEEAVNLSAFLVDWQSSGVWTVGFIHAERRRPARRGRAGAGLDRGDRSDRQGARNRRRHRRHHRSAGRSCCGCARTWTRCRSDCGCRQASTKS